MSETYRTREMKRTYEHLVRKCKENRPLCRPKNNKNSVRIMTRFSWFRCRHWWTQQRTVVFQKYLDQFRK
jgi:hypothetical protein